MTYHNLKSSGCAIALCALSAMPTLFSCSGKSSDMKQILAERDSTQVSDLDFKPFEHTL